MNANPLTIENIKNGKIKLQFGNPEQIKLAKEAEKLTSIKKFKVTFDILDTAEIIVEANDAEEAEEIANDKLTLDDFEIIVEVEKVTEC